jgi:hypothetical protein
MTKKGNFKKLERKLDRAFSRQLLLRWVKELALIRKLINGRLNDLERKRFDLTVGG